MTAAPCCDVCRPRWAATVATYRTGCACCPPGLLCDFHHLPGDVPLDAVRANVWGAYDEPKGMGGDDA